MLFANPLLRALCLGTLAMTFSASANAAEPIPAPEQSAVFVSGEEGYHTFRIPALYVTQSGTVLAFCEGRKSAGHDSGNIDTVLKRSLDGGKTWGPLQVVADDGPNTMGNPCPIQDRDTGVVWLPLTRNLGHDNEGEIKNQTSDEPRTVWMTKSEDDGVTWEKAWEITETTSQPDWTWYATGPGNSIQLSTGRLLVPCDHAVAVTKMFRSHVIYSDDHGATWELGGVVGDYMNECAAIEKEDGGVLINMRSYNGKNRRGVATSPDGGESWGPIRLDEELVEPVCQASMIRLSTTKEGKNRILFSNPANKKRVEMTVKLSYDEGESWPVAKLLNKGPSAYSSLAVLPDGSIACLYERGPDNPYRTITYATFSLEWLTDGADSMGAR